MRKYLFMVISEFSGTGAVILHTWSCIDADLCGAILASLMLFTPATLLATTPTCATEPLLPAAYDCGSLCFYPLITLVLLEVSVRHNFHHCSKLFLNDAASVQ